MRSSQQVNFTLLNYFSVEGFTILEKCVEILGTDRVENQSMDTFLTADEINSIVIEANHWIEGLLLLVFKLFKF
jgi:hypothetical protein